MARPNWQLVVHRTSKTSRTSAGVGVMLADQFTVDRRRQIARRGLVESLPTCGKVEAQHRSVNQVLANEPATGN